MDLLETLHKFIEVSTGGSTSPAHYLEVLKELEEAFVRCQDPDEIKTALKMAQEVHYFLIPFEVKNTAYERLLVLTGRASDVLREYAVHLRLHGPEWDEHVKKLDEEVDQLDKKQK